MIGQTDSMARARATFKTLCKALEKEKWHYEKYEDKLTVVCGAQGDGLPIELNIRIDAEGQLVQLLSCLPYKVKEDKRIEVAIAVSAVNYSIVHGCFDYDVTDGSLYFRMTNSFSDCVPGTEVFSYMIYASCGTIDEYSDKFFMISKGMTSVEQFLAFECGIEEEGE